MRSLAVLAVALPVLALSAPAASSTTPTLRVGPSTSLSLVGSGFEPRVLVTLRVVSPALSRTVKVRTSARGAFTFRFAGVERCAPRHVTARMPNGSGARISPAWFARDCLPPPPLQPGTPPPQPGSAAAA